jgi:hypothetical protein
MKARNLVLLGCLAALVPAGTANVHGQQVTTPALSPVVMNELRALDETYVLLDAVAARVWAGWTGYREVPFLFDFENHLRVLVGHPNPPPPFELVAGVNVAGRPVAADRSRVTAVRVQPYLSAGGGPINFGSTADGSPVYTVHISLRAPRGSEDDAEAKGTGEPESPTTEDKILVYLHELFHCFQRGRIDPQAGNLSFNADAEFAAWSQLEGVALERAYREPDAARARDRVKEFLVARAMKRRTMTEQQRKEESADDVREGTATYAMLRALELVTAGGFEPKLTAADDRYYRGFANARSMTAKYTERLAKTAARHDDPKMKCYDYGCFQCALSERLFPGWQQAIEQGKPMDAVLAERLPISESERDVIAARMRTEYPYGEASASASKFTTARDAAYRAISGRQGRTYIVDLKKTGQFISVLTRQKDAFRLGLLTLFPSGYPGFALDDVVLSAVGVPANTDQLYYLRVVDTGWRSRSKAYTVSGTRGDDGTYTDALVTTPLFTLKAPKVRIQETGTRVKIQVLSRVR